MPRPCVLFLRLEGEINRDSDEVPNITGDVPPRFGAVDQTPEAWAFVLDPDRCIAAESIDTDSSSSYEYYWLVVYLVSFRGPKIVTWTLSICLLSIVDQQLALRCSNPPRALHPAPPPLDPIHFTDFKAFAAWAEREPPY